MNARLSESALVGLLALVMAIIFINFPEIDLAIATEFKQNNWHWLFTPQSPWLTLPYLWAPRVGKALLILLLICCFYGHYRRYGSFHYYRQLSAFFLLAAIIGPLLIVETGLKNQLGRARPAQIEGLGGPLRFTPAFIPSDQCERNCSFVSGHVATAAFIMAAGWLGTPRTRRRWLCISVLTAGYMSLVRMSSGSHFLSDCLFAWFAVYLGLWLTEQLFRHSGWFERSRRNYRQAIAIAQWRLLRPATMQ